MEPWITVDGHKVRIESSLPAGERSQKIPALVLLHGAGGHAEFWQSHLAVPLAEAGVALFVPHYFDRTGTVRADLQAINDGIHVPLWLDSVRAAVTAVAHEPGMDANRIALLGISLGAFLGLAFAAQQTRDPGLGSRVRCIVELSGGLVDPYRSQAGVSFPPTLILHGEADPIVPVSFAHDLERRLTELGVVHEQLLLPGEGHWFSVAAQLKLLLTVSGFLSRHL